jgi:hypothetical protein
MATNMARLSSNMLLARSWPVQGRVRLGQTMATLNVENEYKDPKFDILSASLKHVQSSGYVTTAVLALYS